MISGFEERRANDGTLELHTRQDGSAPALAVRGISDDAAKSAAKLLLELIDCARDERLVVEQGDRWIVPLGALQLQVAVKREGGLFGLGRAKVLELKDVGRAERSAPTVALSCALTAHGLAEVPFAPLVAREALEKSVAMYGGDASFPDDIDAPFGNHNNHLAYMGLSRIAETDGDIERADEMLCEGLRRSWSAQMRMVGGRLEKIEKHVPREMIAKFLEAMAKGALRIYDNMKPRARIEAGAALVPSPVFTFGGRGRALQQILPVPEPWTALFYEGPGRAAATDPATIALAAEALEAHWRNVAPLVRATAAFPLFDHTRQGQSIETDVEYLPPYQLWTSVFACVVGWTAAGLSAHEIQVLLSIEKDAELRTSGIEKWRVYEKALDAQADVLLAGRGAPS